MTRPLAFAAALLLIATLTVTAHADVHDISVDSKAAWASLDAIDQYALLGNDGYTNINVLTYKADALDPHLTALGRMGYLERCMKSENVVQWAMCQGDVDAFDAAKALAEISADTKHKEEHRTQLKAQVEIVKAALQEHATQVKAAIAKDDAYKKMFELAATARKDWDAHKNAALLELTLAMDDARTTRSRKALAGCEEKTWAAWKAAVSAIPAKRFSLVYKDLFSEVEEAAAATIVGEPDGYLAAVALTACSDGERDMLLKNVEHALLFWPGYRGPRNASQLAIMQAKLTLDERGAEITYPGIDRRELFTGNGNGGDMSSSGGGHAPVVSMKPNGKLTHLTFGPTKTKETQCTDYRAGKRLSRIESDGRLVYEGTCYKYAQVTVTHDPPSPIDTPSRYATALKIGTFVSFTEKWPLIGTASLTATAPSYVFGVAVK